MVNSRLSRNDLESKDIGIQKSAKTRGIAYDYDTLSLVLNNHLLIIMSTNLLLITLANMEDKTRIF